ncbi:M23 family metallopeptidase [Microbacterium oryzae]|uniref:M23 family metallopeptidase n=1 Tax=Microbacterium oryzae TaxID=743009 RepID=UPI0025B04FAD|nr:M23 family metallopeptidase [Microbacterium oryzae]MDN3311147.1 M23 family metallopeptidase [Microbacterium oryzae]
MPTAEAAHQRRSRRTPGAALTPNQQGQTMRTAVADTALPEPPLTRRRLRELASATPAPEIIDDGDADFGEPLKVAEHVAGSAPATGAIPLGSAESDEFLAAARALQFTGETPVTPAAQPVAAGIPAPAVEEHVAPRRGRGFRRVATTTASLGAMGVIGLLAVGMTTPLGALAQDGGSSASAAVSIAAGASQELGDEEIQAFVASSDVQNADVERAQGYSAETVPTVASADGISTSGAFFTNDASADIQWPFAVGTSMSSGYGQRWGRLHEGVDFTPGDGAPVQAIADGVVRIATESGGAYGVTVYVDHVIDGQVVTSHYAHMQYGSLRVTQGQRVQVGDIVGLTGNTGRSYGAHMHFEIIINGATTDPLPWLQEHANTRYSDDEAAAAQTAIGDLLGSEITAG